MTDGQALLRAILAAPDDDAPRLIYADWLEENGQPERAEFIRIQIELARIGHSHPNEAWRKAYVERNPGALPMCPECSPLHGRERNLWAMSLGWAHPFNGELDWFRRGFVHSLTLPAADWLAHADRIVAAHPVREVRLTTPLRHFMHFGRGITWTPNGEAWTTDSWPGITFHLPEPRAATLQFNGASYPLADWSLRWEES